MSVHRLKAACGHNHGTTLTLISADLDNVFMTGLASGRMVVELRIDLLLIITNIVGRRCCVRYDEVDELNRQAVVTER